jgi:ribose transport system substrate-binding protein
VSCGQAASGCANTTAAIADAAKAIGWTPRICDGKFDVNDAYGACITQGLADHVSGILLSSGFDCDLIQPQLKAAKTANVPVVANQSVDCNDPLSTVQGPSLFTSMLMSQKYPNVTDWQYARGKAIADYIIAKTNGKAKVIDEHFAGQLLGVYQDKGFVAGMATCAGCKIVASVAISNAVLAQGQDHQLMSAAAVKNPDANAIAYAFSSFVQSSQLQAIATQMGNHPVVAGGEGEPNNLDLIRSGAGVPTGEAAYNGPQLAWGLVDTLNRIFAGQKPTPEGIGWAMADKTHNLPSTAGEYFQPPSNWKAAYLGVWGT